LLQLDSDKHASVFDSVVAIDAGVEQLLRHGDVATSEVRDLVHGAMFTRGPADLKHTAIFIGGSNVDAGEALLAHVRKCFFGPMRVSVMLDANGANTTASAAVIAAARHLSLKDCTTLVLAGTGPVGQRIVRLLASAGAKVRVASRSLDRARQACQSIEQHVDGAQVTPVAPQNNDELQAALDGVALVFAAGAAGVELLPLAVRQSAKSLRVAIDLNAVSPVGIAGIGVADKAVEQQGVVCYGAVGVGGTKMKIHKAAIRRLFESNDAVLDADEIYAIGQQLEAAGG
jgi:hypothetical protein